MKISKTRLIQIGIIVSIGVISHLQGYIYNPNTNEGKKQETPAPKY